MYTILASLIICCFLELFTALVSCSVDLIQCGSSVCRKRKTILFFITPEALGITDYRGFFAENHIYVNYASKTMYFHSYTLLFPYCLLKLKVTRSLITVSLKLKKWLIQGIKRAHTHTIQKLLLCNSLEDPLCLAFVCVFLENFLIYFAFQSFRSRIYLNGMLNCLCCSTCSN